MSSILEKSAPRTGNGSSFGRVKVMPKVGVDIGFAPLILGYAPPRADLGNKKPGTMAGLVEN
ncbi:hypothetical protein ABE527_15950 [Brucella sp. TWI432]